MSLHPRVHGFVPIAAGLLESIEAFVELAHKLLTISPWLGISFWLVHVQVFFHICMEVGSADVHLVDSVALAGSNC